MSMLDISAIDHTIFMKEALKEAKTAGEHGDLPIGAVIVHNGKIISRGSNSINSQKNNILHAENTAIMSCGLYLLEYARESILYTTVEPCVMCVSTAVMANIRNIVFAIEDKYMNTKSFIDSNLYLKKRVHNYISGVLGEESLKLLEKYLSTEDLQIIITGNR
jgi:tRNA(Arg) A34 adenosine deaminase TadA